MKYTNPEGNEKDQEDDGKYQESSIDIVQKKSTDNKETTDKKKYDFAKKIPIHIIRDQYQNDWDSDIEKIRQRGVILYIIDMLALRPGIKENQSKTTGCCSLKKNHLTLYDQYGDHEFVVKFKFFGKCSIPYYKLMQVEQRVFENLQGFLKNKSQMHYVFDKINTRCLNTYLKTFMDGLTAKVLRTNHACLMMQEELTNLTSVGDTKTEKIQSFKEASNKVAKYLNHKHNVTKQQENLQTKNKVKKYQVNSKSALLDYIDPRIVVAWCKTWNVQVENVYNKTLQTKFKWAMTEAADYKF